MQIAGGTFAATSTSLTWTLDVVGLPATLTFDQAAVPANYVEYEWGVDLDSDGDGKPNFQVSAQHVRMAGAPELVTGDILAATQENLWTVQGAGSIATGPITATLAGTTFTFTVQLTEYPALAAITDASQSTWSTYSMSGSDPGDQCTDTWKP
jgi:hypothetical protein